jgi:AcrR family transcriptional regulator
MDRMKTRKAALRKNPRGRKIPPRMARVRSPRPAYRFRGTKPEPDAVRRSAATQRAILAAAARLVRRLGYSRVTIEAIAAEAGAGKQTIYRWWKTKAALFAELLEDTAAAPPARRARGSALAELRHVVARLARRQSSRLTTQIYAGLMAEPGTVMIRLIQAQGETLRTILARARVRREIRRTADITLAAEQLLAALWFRNLMGTRRLDSRFAQRLVAQTLRGLTR